MKKENFERNIALIMTYIHFIIFSLLKNRIFNINLKIIIENHGIGIVRYIIYTIISLVLYFCIYRLLIRIIINIKNKDKATIEKLRHFLIYFIFNIIILILTWPGIWRWDEFNILSYVSNYDYFYWQNYITSIFYIISYMIIPIPSGVIIIQLVIVSLIFSYLMYNCNKILKLGKIVYLLYIPFLLLPVIDHNIYPLRLTIYSYVEMLLIFQLLFIKKAKNTKWSYIVLTAILVILTCLRTEGKVFFLIIPIIFLCILKEKIKPLKQRMMYTCITIVTSIVLIIPQDAYYKYEASNKYDVTSFINQLYVVAQKEMQVNPDSEYLKKIDEVINLEALLNEERGIEAHNKETIYRNNTSEEQYNELKKICIKLALKYPKEVILERLYTFGATSGLVKDKNVHVEDTRNIYNIDNRNVLAFREEYRKFNQAD